MAARAPDLLLWTSLQLLECEQRLTMLSRGGFYAWKQLTGRSEHDRITRLVGPSQFQLARTSSGEFWLLPTWGRRVAISYRWFEPNTYHYQICLSADTGGTRVRFVRGSLYHAARGEMSIIRAAILCLGTGLYIFWLSVNKLNDNGMHVGWIAGLLVSIGFAVMGLRLVFPRKNCRSFEEDLLLYLKETIDAETVPPDRSSLS